MCQGRERPRLLRDALPAPVEEALVRQVPGLVGHRRALGDVEAEVEVAQAPAPAQLELLEDREDSGREALEVGVEVEVDGGEGVVGAVDDGDTDELAGVAVADLEGVAAG